MRDSIFLAALALAGTAALVASARAGQAAMRWAIHGSLEALGTAGSVRRG